MNTNLMITYMFTKYVDDSNVILENLPKGARWNVKDKKLTYREEDVKEDEENCREPEEVTMKAWGAMASSVIPGLVFTVDYPQLHENRKVPMLDFMVWKEKVPSQDNREEDEKETILYEFYEKPVASKLVMMKDSAMPHRMIMASMVQEGVRRLTNTHRSISDSRKGKILGRYMAKLKASGYPQGMRKEILTAASGPRGSVSWRMTLVSDHSTVLATMAGRPPGGKRSQPKLNGLERGVQPGRTRRTRWPGPWLPAARGLLGTCMQGRVLARLEARGYGGGEGGGRRNHDPDSVPGPNMKECSSSRRPQQARVEAVMFLPHTPGGVLARQLQEKEDQFAKLHQIGRVKMVERGGRKLKDVLTVKDPWTSGPCGRGDCLVCVGDPRDKKKDKPQPGSCRRESVVYMLTCRSCKDKGLLSCYYGESSRTAYLRGKEHGRGQELKNKDNALAKHDVSPSRGRAGILHDESRQIAQESCPAPNSRGHPH